MTKYNRPNGKLFGSSATNIGRFGSGQAGETYTTTTDPNVANTLGTHWEEGWNGAVVSQAPYTAPFIEDMNAVNYVNSYNSAYLLQRGIPEYSATEEYQEDSVCTYNGEIWICQTDGTVGVTPDESAPEWHQQTELPVMSDNEILVGSTGVGATVTDTLNQGDILASTSGLEIKSGSIVNADINSSAAIAESKLALDYSTSSLNSTLSGHITDTANPHSVTKAQVLTGNLIVNADVDASAAIAESKLALDYSTSSLNTAITNHTTDTANPHDTTVSNLDDTTITAPIGDGDVLLYDDNSSKWINSDSLTTHLNDTNNPHQTSIANLTDVFTGTPVDMDVMWYNDVSQKWEFTQTLATHVSDTNNPHTTTLVNLDDTTITTPQDGDAIIYDNNSSKWVNTPLPGGSLSTLTDTTITTPSDKQLLQYDYANSKWVNSSDVWSQIEVNDIANMNTAVSDITLTVSDKRSQIFTTATNGFNITLPGTGIKKGEKFTFQWYGGNDTTGYTTPFCIKSSDGTALRYCYTRHWVYEFTATADNPGSSAWAFSYRKRFEPTWDAQKDQSGITLTANNTKEAAFSGAFFSLPPGLYNLEIRFGVDGSAMTNANNCCGIRLYTVVGGNNKILVSNNNKLLGMYTRLNFSPSFVASIAATNMIDGNLSYTSRGMPYNMSTLFNQKWMNSMPIYGFYSITSGANATAYALSEVRCSLANPATTLLTLS